jgi:hypothetical protein
MSFDKKNLSIVVLFLPIFLAAVTVAAQPTDPGGGGDPDKVPITGIEYLLVSGGLLGGYKLFKKTSRKSS